MPTPWTPERRARHSAIMKARELDPEFQKKIAASRAANLARGQNPTVEERARKSAKIASIAATPEWKFKQQVGYQKAITRRERRRRANTAPAWCPPMLAEHYLKMRRAIGAAKAKKETLAMMEKDPKMWPFKKRDPLAAIERIQAHSLQPGDVLLVTMPEGYPTDLMAECTKMLRGYLGDVPFKVIVAQAGTEFTVARSADQPPPGALRTSG